MQRIIILLAALISGLFAAPSQYHIKKLPTGSTPVMDGNLAEWPEAYFLDSLRSDTNCLDRDDSIWTPRDFQMKVYAAHDGAVVYFAIRVISDDAYRPCHTLGSCDAIKVNPGGQAMGFYLFPDSVFRVNPSCPFTLGTTLWGGAQMEGNNNLPTYELSFVKNILDLDSLGSFQLAVTCDDEDSANNRNMLEAGIGIEFTGNKQDWGGGEWDNPLHYPTFILDTVIGPAILGGGMDVTPPVVGSVSTINIGATGASVSVTTNEPAWVTVLYNLKSAQGTGFYTSQTVKLTGLWPNTLYSYDVKVEDEYGNSDTVGPYSFTTSDTIMPSRYLIHPVAGFTPVVDGSIGEWPASFFLDSLHGDENVYVRTGGLWTRNEIQYQVSAAFDADRVYFSVKVIADNAPRTGNMLRSFDNFKLNPGGDQMQMQIMSGGTIIKGPSCPFDTSDHTFAGGVNPAGNGSYATYECSISRMVLDPFNIGSFTFSVGMDDEDTLNGLNTCYTAIGAAYTGNKQSWGSNPWDNPAYYPTFILEGVGVEIKSSIKNNSDLNIHPNPFNPAVTIEIPGNLAASKVEILSVTGRIVAAMNVAGKSQVTWDASRFSAGVYVVRVAGEKGTMERRISFIK